MSFWQWVSVAAAALLFFWGVGAYNRLMALRNAIGDAFVQLDTQLRERSDICDRLLAAVAPRLPSEQATFDALVNAQTESQTAAQAARGKPWSPDPIR